jgi:hypothetical protein
MKPMSGTPLICNEANFNLFSYQQSTLYSKGKKHFDLSTLSLFHDHAAVEANKDEGDAEITHLFISYRGYCARKGVSAN